MTQLVTEMHPLASGRRLAAPAPAPVVSRPPAAGRLDSRWGQWVTRRQQRDRLLQRRLQMASMITALLAGLWAALTLLGS
jgi:hypothetical protein